MRRILRSAGFDLVRFRRDDQVDISPDYDELVVETIRHVRPFTQTSPQRIVSLCDATRYIVTAQIPGDIVECGVWRGGSMMAVARILLETGDTARDLFLYDTFEGMPQPGEKDVTYSGTTASTLMHQGRKDDPSSIWCYAPLEAVKNLVCGVGYPREKIHFAQGKFDSWAIRWYASMFIAYGQCVRPARSLVHNAGFDNAGVHCGKSALFDVELSDLAPDRWPEKVEECRVAIDAMEELFLSFRPSWVQRIAQGLRPRLGRLTPSSSV